MTLEGQLMPQFSGDRPNLQARRELRLGRIIVDGQDTVNCYFGILVMIKLVHLQSRRIYAAREDYCGAAERAVPIGLGRAHQPGWRSQFKRGCCAQGLPGLFSAVCPWLGGQTERQLPGAEKLGRFRSLPGRRLRFEIAGWENLQEENKLPASLGVVSKRNAVSGRADPKPFDRAVVRAILPRRGTARRVRADAIS